MVSNPAHQTFGKQLPSVGKETLEIKTDEHPKRTGVLSLKLQRMLLSPTSTRRIPSKRKQNHELLTHLGPTGFREPIERRGIELRNEM
eukprot:952185-Amphidinium_carterae.1